MEEIFHSAAYEPEGVGIRCHNGVRFHNRPLYCSHRPAAVLAGDRPHLRFLARPIDYGCFMLAFMRQDTGIWLHEFSEREVVFRPNTAEWVLADAAFPGLQVQMQVVPAAQESGWSVHLYVSGARPGDVVVWASGGVASQASQDLFWDADPSIHPDLTERSFLAEDCRHNIVSLQGEQFALTTAACAGQRLVGCCSLPSTMFIADALQWSDPALLLRSRGQELPLLCGVVLLDDAACELYWKMQIVDALSHIVGQEADTLHAAFAAGVTRARLIEKSIQVATPDVYLNAGVAAANAAMDACYYPPMFVHGAMAWNNPLIGWRSLYGPTVLGWHDRVLTEAEHVLKHQIQTSPYTTFQSNPDRRLSLQSDDSRYFGVGRVPDTGTFHSTASDLAPTADFYNMQEVFFDQLLHAWRWTGDPRLETLLRPALDIELEWQRACFDGDNDGVYESYLNIWASDSLWYNGGGTAQSTAYAYAGHQAALEMAQRADDQEKVSYHTERRDAIRRGMLASLWISEHGYLAEYRDALGHRRRHDDASLSTIFLPIDAGMMTEMEAVQMLHYTEWGLERLHLDEGGQLCWTSNFVPYEWSVRELAFADILHLALAYYQTGMGASGWELLKGVLSTSMFRSIVPGALIIAPVDRNLRMGSLSIDYGTRATDFADTTSLFQRVIVEGLYGFRPNRPQGKVICAPQFPVEWDHATITTPDFTCIFERRGDLAIYRLDMQQKADLLWELALDSSQIERVEVDGQDASWEVRPGFDHPILLVHAGSQLTSEVRILTHKRAELMKRQQFSGRPGECISADVLAGTILEVRDPQGILRAVECAGSTLEGTLTDLPGHHLVLLLVEVRNTRYWHSLHIHIRQNVLLSPPSRPDVATADWECCSIEQVLNADLRRIYQQQYLSPRPQTCSVQIGVDGYSPWTFAFWQLAPPLIDFSHVAERLDERGWLWTESGVPFRWHPGEHNAALTSLWDNWPERVTVPVQAQGSVVWLLIAGTTNHMQTKIANGIVRFRYADGEEDTMELVHPTNYWSLSANYEYTYDSFALSPTPPLQIDLGNHCRAMIVRQELRSHSPLESVTLECLSQEVVIGLLAITLMK